MYALLNKFGRSLIIIKTKSILSLKKVLEKKYILHCIAHPLLTLIFEVIKLFLPVPFSPVWMKGNWQGPGRKPLQSWHSILWNIIPSDISWSLPYWPFIRPWRCGFVLETGHSRDGLPVWLCWLFNWAFIIFSAAMGFILFAYIFIRFFILLAAHNHEYEIGNHVSPLNE